MPAHPGMTASRRGRAGSDTAQSPGPPAVASSTGKDRRPLKSVRQTPACAARRPLRWQSPLRKTGKRVLTTVAAQHVWLSNVPLGVNVLWFGPQVFESRDTRSARGEWSNRPSAGKCSPNASFRRRRCCGEKVSAVLGFSSGSSWPFFYL